MKTSKVLLLTLACCMPLAGYAHTEASKQVTDKTDQARTVVKSFAKNLKSTLQTSVKNDGFEAAIDVCHLQAAPIAQKVAKQHDWQVARTSLKVRNEQNQPDNWERKVLTDFEKRKTAGEALNTMEYAEHVMVDGKPVYRYMKAIGTAEVCLACHGETLATPIAAKLDQLYPKDQARGFKLGDIRGAFTLQKSVDE